MSSSDRPLHGRTARLLRVAGAGLAALALAVAAGCTARPLYGDAGNAAGLAGPQAAVLAAVDIPPAQDRVGQELRNHLIFMFGGGSGRPARPEYRLDLDTRVSKSAPATVNTGRVSLEPTAGTVSVSARYRLTEPATGRLVAQGTRAVQAPYDIPAQDFAAARAVRDAENRAARELAELLRLVVAQELRR